MNRRVRNRTHGGVGGRELQNSLLPDDRYGVRVSHAAGKIYKTLRGSLRFKPYSKSILISYPRNAKGFIMSKYNEAEGDEKVYRDKKATWEVRPDIERSKYDREFTLDERDAQTRYGCDPPEGSINPFMKVLFKDIDDCFTLDPSVDNVTYFDPENKQFTPHFVDKFLRNKSVFVGVDLARIGVVGFSILGNSGGLYWSGQITPKGGKTDFRTVKRLLTQIKTFCKDDGVIVVADSYHYTWLEQTCLNLGFPDYHLIMRKESLDDWDTLALMIGNKEISGYHSKNLIHELKCLINPSGNKVVASDQERKDEADALCRCVAEYAERKREQEENKVSAEVLEVDGYNDLAKYFGKPKPDHVRAGDLTLVI